MRRIFTGGSKIKGQVEAIDRMIDEDVPCEDILIQINAVKGVIQKVGQVVLEGHLQHCIKDGIEHGDAQATIDKFAKAIEYFARMYRQWHGVVPAYAYPYGYQEERRSAFLFGLKTYRNGYG